MNKNRRKEIENVQEDIHEISIYIERLIDECAKDGEGENVIKTLQSVQDHIMSADSYLDNARN